MGYFGSFAVRPIALYIMSLLFTSLPLYFVFTMPHRSNGPFSATHHLPSIYRTPLTISLPSLSHHC